MTGQRLLHYESTARAQACDAGRDGVGVGGAALQEAPYVGC